MAMNEQSPKHIQQSEFSDIMVDFTDSAVEHDVEVSHVLKLWVDWLLTLPKNMRLLEQIHRANDVPTHRKTH